MGVHEGAHQEGCECKAECKDGLSHKEYKNFERFY